MTASDRDCCGRKMVVVRQSRFVEVCLGVAWSVAVRQLWLVKALFGESRSVWARYGKAVMVVQG